MKCSEASGEAELPCFVLAGELVFTTEPDSPCLIGQLSLIGHLLLGRDEQGEGILFLWPPFNLLPYKTRSHDTKDRHGRLNCVINIMSNLSIANPTIPDCRITVSN